jgi:hypothetical protein
MNEEIKQKLREAGREDLIKIHEINQSGYAGCMPNGNIVDRREFPEAIPIQKNSIFGIPEPKKLFDLNCIVCGKEFKGEEPQMCCSGKDCGCMGIPIDPVVCSKVCYDNLPHNKNS